MAQLNFQFFDCDNHYYEALDAFTRHIEPEFRKRAMQWANIDGKQRLIVGGKVNRFIPNPTFDPVAKPGAMDEYFRGRNPKGADMNAAFRRTGADPSGLSGPRRPTRADGRAGHARRHHVADTGRRHGTGAAAGSRALAATFRAFNRWMDEDWGFAYKERIFAAPYITLCDPQNAVRELEWALEHDARFIVMIPGPITTAEGMKAPGDPMFDDFWQLANDSGITVTYHSGETYYSKYLIAWGEPDYISPSSRRSGSGPCSPATPYRTLSRTSCCAGTSTSSQTCAWRPSKVDRNGCSTYTKSSRRPTE